MTTREVAKALGLSRAAVERAEHSALAKLRAFFEERGLTYDDLCVEHDAFHPLGNLKGD